MIRIVAIQGDVLIEDRRLGYMQMAQPGMLLEDRGDILVVTNTTSRATINAGGIDVKLGPLSLMRIRPDGRTWWDRHGLAPFGDARWWIDLIWDKLGPREREVAVNAGGGVRG